MYNKTVQSKLREKTDLLLTRFVTTVGATSDQNTAQSFSEDPALPYNTNEPSTFGYFSNIITRTQCRLLGYDSYALGKGETFLRLVNMVLDAIWRT